MCVCVCVCDREREIKAERAYILERDQSGERDHSVFDVLSRRGSAGVTERSTVK